MSLLDKLKKWLEDNFSPLKPKHIGVLNERA